TGAEYHPGPERTSRGDAQADLVALVVAAFFAPIRPSALPLRVLFGRLGRLLRGLLLLARLLVLLEDLPHTVGVGRGRSQLEIALVVLDRVLLVLLRRVGDREAALGARERRVELERARVGLDRIVGLALALEREAVPLFERLDRLLLLLGRGADRG